MVAIELETDFINGAVTMGHPLFSSVGTTPSLEGYADEAVVSAAKTPLDDDDLEDDEDEDADLEDDDDNLEDDEDEEEDNEDEDDLEDDDIDEEDDEDEDEDEEEPTEDDPKPLRVKTRL